MRNYSAILLVILLAFGSLSCSQAIEFSKTIWGSSTRPLENARVDAVKETFDCPLDTCFDIVLEMTEDDLSADPPKERIFDLFIKNKKKQLIVIMGVPESIDTTEVGIFFTAKEGTTLIEVSSLSRTAKRVASQIIFDEIKKQYQVVN